MPTAANFDDDASARAQLGLAMVIDGQAMLTPRGREVVLRGSPRLWDMAA